jgi:hypothetical protein
MTGYSSIFKKYQQHLRQRNLRVYAIR